MPQVTQISPQKSRRAGLMVGNFDRVLNNQPVKKGFFNIFVDGEFAFGLDEETLYKEQIKEGQELSPTRLEELKDGVVFSKALNRALNFLSFRPRSKKEILVYLQTKVLKDPKDRNIVEANNEEISNKVIKKLESWGYLNDEEFARWLVEQRQSSKNPKGPLALKQELFQKGVGRELVEKVVCQSSLNTDQENVLRLLEKKDKKLHLMPPRERRQKLLLSLISRGFDYGQAQVLVAQYLKGA